jgi:hypothetical protein
MGTHLAAVQSRENRQIGFSESEREGRASAADENADGSISYALTGPSPQGEEDTLAVCRKLIAKLNRAGSNWSEPVLGTAGVDCEACNPLDEEKTLSIQVVRAIVDPEFSRHLSEVGHIQGRDDMERLAQYLRDAIGHKASEKKIPTRLRSGLVLALDANRLSHLTLDAVVEEFKIHHGDWASSLGFKEIWLVGPVDDLTWRLDIATSVS